VKEKNLTWRYQLQRRVYFLKQYKPFQLYHMMLDGITEFWTDCHKKLTQDSFFGISNTIPDRFNVISNIVSPAAVL
jgi:hypothetical protein